MQEAQRRRMVPSARLEASGSPMSRGGSVIVLQQATEPLTRQNAAVADDLGGHRHDQLIAQALMVAFAMIVLDELADGSPERPFTDENHPVQAGFLDRPYEALRVRIGVSHQLHRRRSVRRKPFASRILSIRCVGASSSSSNVVRHGASTASSFTMTQDNWRGSRGSGPIASLTIRPCSSALAGRISGTRPLSVSRSPGAPRPALGAKAIMSVMEITPHVTSKLCRSSSGC